MTDDTDSDTDGERSLYERWQEHKDRPAWVRRHRHEIADAADLDEEIPRSLPRIDQWLDGHKGVVTRRLDPDFEAPGADDALEDDTDPTEEED